MATGFLLLAMAAFAGTAWAAQAAGSQTYAVVVSGLGGEPEYEKLIQGWGKDLSSFLKKNPQSENQVYWLAAAKENGAVYAESRSEEIVKLFDALASRVRPADVFQLFLVGHGSYDGYDYRFNIPGPDLTASQWNELLGRVRAERQLVAAMTSASGGSLETLRRKGRVVITSTTVGRERNFSVFARYFIEALGEAATDIDKNQVISALEAFRYAGRETARYYESLKRLATEHAVIEDRGDTEGVRDPSPENGQGLLASAMAVIRLGEGSAALDTPATRELRAAKRNIEEQIEQLKYRKASLTSEEYMGQLEELLLNLARLQQQLDDLETAPE